MTLRRVFALNFVLAVCFGATCVLAPRALCALYGLTADTGAVWTSRLLGGSLLGFASLMWFGARTPSVEVQRAIAAALLIQDLVGAAASLAVQVGGAMNAIGWSNVLIYALLGASYAYLLVVPTRRTN